jgi:hypothetical protein
LNPVLNQTSFSFQTKFLSEKLQEKELDYRSKKLELQRVREKTKTALKEINRVKRESQHVIQDNLDLERQLNLLLKLNLLDA